MVSGVTFMFFFEGAYVIGIEYLVIIVMDIWILFIMGLVWLFIEFLL